LLLVVACIIAGLALSVFSLPLFQGSTVERPRKVRRAPAPETKASVEASVPGKPPETSPDTETAAIETEKVATPPALEPTRPEVSAAKDSPTPQPEPVAEPHDERSSAPESAEDATTPEVDAAPLEETDVEAATPPASSPADEVNLALAAEEIEKAVVESVPDEPAVQPGDLVGPDSDVIEPVVLEMPKLHYPREAERRKLEAVVRVRVLVDENGKVMKAEVEGSAGHGFDEAALSVAVRTQFIPATKGTVPVKMWTSFPIVYRLEKE
jgi:TonB family protein